MPAKKTSAFDEIAAPKKPAKKSKVKVVEAPALSDAIKRWIDADQRLKVADAEKKAAEAEILPVGEGHRIAASIEAHTAVPSVRLASEGGIVTVTQDPRYSDISDEHVDALSETFPDDFDRYFQTKRVITVKEDADLDALVALVGKDNLSKFFNVFRTAKVTREFHDARSSKPEVAAKAAPFMGTALRPWKGAIRAYATDEE